MEKPLSEQKLEDIDFYARTEQDVLFLKMYDSKLDQMSKSFSIFEKKIDKFKNEIRINIFRSRCYMFPYEHPIDLLYISNPRGEGLYVLYTGTDFIDQTGSLIINIDDRTNLELKINDNDVILQGKTCDRLRLLDDDAEHFYSEYRSYLYISKEDFLKCCNANSLSIKVCPNDYDTTAYEENCDDLIPYFQMLYNETCDGQMFVYDKQEILDARASELRKRRDREHLEYEKEEKEKERKEQHKKNEDTLILLIAIIVTVLGLLPFIIHMLE